MGVSERKTQPLNVPKKWSIAAVFVVGAYFGLTWFFFGSTHPCGILEVRQRPYVIKRYIATALSATKADREEMVEDWQRAQDAKTSGNLREMEAANESLQLSAKSFEKSSRDFLDARKRAVYYLHERISNDYTPAKCLWEVLVWNADPYRDSPLLEDDLKKAE